MCKVKTPEMPATAVEPAKEHAAARTPDGDEARSTSARRAVDGRRAGYQTILTSQQKGMPLALGMLGKTLLGG